MNLYFIKFLNEFISRFLHLKKKWLIILFIYSLCKFYIIMLYPAVKNLIKTNYKDLKIYFVNKSMVNPYYKIVAHGQHS